MLKQSLIAKTDAKANSGQIYLGNSYRITVLTKRLIRFEFSKENKFTDLPTQTVWFRNFSPVKFTVSEKGGKVITETDDVIFTVSKKSGKALSVYFKDNKVLKKCSNSNNFKGTRRTLDGTFGKVKLDDGLITKNGVYVLDDSNSLLINKEHLFQARKDKEKDLYIFAYEKNYRECINAFYKISSPVPLIPRFALGVWWSRYHAYTQDEYLNLIARFKKENIPLTVATVDMDWHWVDIKKQFNQKFGGWTGYSWNTNLFPDYKEFLRKLKEDNLHVTLNLHPADGVRPYEDMYKDMAKAVGIDAKTKETVPFKCGEAKYWNAYFDILHKPYEKDGVDFWWIDWQQGKRSDVKGLDPLIALNHFHYLDNAENNQIPMILSRYSGLGSHRYPLGFSGDTAISWRVLDFQPYFTVNAANAAYTWWSHDIGGHHMGCKNDDLYLRWLQFGTFSPIMRLHSTADELLGKEPWKYRSDVYEGAKKILRLRHRLIPYIYTMDYRTHKDGLALCEPMYYSYPDEEKAYSVKNQYMFGSELMVCPITSPQNKETNLGSVKAWIPKGVYTDIFTGQRYCGPCEITLNRDINYIPVLAKEGAIIPLSSDAGNSVKNPENLELWVYPGNNKFTLYEDDGSTDFANHNASTLIENYYDGKNNTANLIINTPVGDENVIVKNRHYKVVFKGICAQNISVSAEAEISRDDSENPIVEFTAGDEAVIISLSDINAVKADDVRDRIICAMSRWQEKTFKKNRAFRIFDKVTDEESALKALKKSRLPKAVHDAVCEAILGCFDGLASKNSAAAVIGNLPNVD